MQVPEWLNLAFGVGSALSWGAGDFSGGFATRRSSALTVIFYSQWVGGALMLAMAWLLAEKIPPVSFFLFGAGAGLFGVLGLICLYKGLAMGRMGLVAPISAIMTAILPILFSLALEGLPRITQLLGFGLGLFAVFLLSLGDGDGRVTAMELVLSLVAGVCFGLFFIFLGWVSHEAILWPLVGARCASLALLAGLLVYLKPQRKPVKADFIFIVLAGILDVAGNSFFALAARYGRLDISAVLASFYPAATVLLARLVLKEVMQPRQWAGVAMALAALGLIAG